MKELETIDIELSNDEIAALALMAHERDITLNALIVEILERAAEDIVTGFDGESQ